MAQDPGRGGRRNRGHSLSQREREAERRAQVLDLWRQNLHPEEIARRVGYGHRQAVYRALNAALRDLWIEPAEDVRQLQLGRLDAIFQGLANAGALDGDPKAAIAAVRVIERQCKLQGLDAPEKHEHTGKDGGPIAIDVSTLTDEQLRAYSAGIAIAGPAERGGTGAPEAHPGGLADAPRPDADPPLAGADAAAIGGDPDRDGGD